MSSIWEEVKSRKIFKAATIYAAVAWGIIQIADVLLPVLGQEDWIMSSMVLVAFAGFPIALITGWMYDIRIARRQQVSGENSDTQHSTAIRILEIAVIGAFGLSAAYLYYNSSGEPAKATPSQQTELQKILQTEEGQKTIAVLPFASFSESNNDEFFADGLSEELLNVLARNKKLRVAARTSSFQYKNTNINVRKIAHELNVQYVLEGSVRRSGDLIRITAQLIKADEDRHVFSKTWDRNTTNVFKVQDEIAQSVMNELKVSLLGEQQVADGDIGTKSIDAFAEYSKGLAYLRNRGEKDFENAIVNFNKALGIDPNYAEAMAMLAETYLLQVSYGLKKFDEASVLANPLIERALMIKPDIGSAHAVKGLLYWQKAGNSDNANAVASEKGSDASLEVAKSHLIKAINLNPSNAEAYMWYGSILQSQGDFKDGAELRRKAYEIDPQAAVVGFNRAQDLIWMGDYKGAMDVFNAVVRNNPNYPQAYSIAGDVSRQVGQLDQAYGMYQRLADLSGNNTDWLLQSTNILIPMGEYQRAQQNVDRLKESNNHKYKMKFDMLQAFIWVASKDYQSFAQWVETFPENSNDQEQLFWRGFLYMNQEKWQYAVEDLSRAHQLNQERNMHKTSDDVIRISLMLAKAYKMLGDQLKTEHYLSSAQEAIKLQREQGIVNNNLRYFEASYEMLNEKSEVATALLRQAIQEGFVNFWWAENDPIFNPVRDDKDYLSVKQEFDIRMRVMQKNIESQYGQFASGR